MLSHHFAQAVFLFAIAGGTFALPSNSSFCKNVPGSEGWPSIDEWHQLNKTLGGVLLAPLPPAVVCDPTKPSYSTQACATIGALWSNDSLPISDPVTLEVPNWQQDACLPTAVYNLSTTCDLWPFPKFTVNASNAQHVVDAVKFANEHNVHLSIKNTGHDYLGRSTSPDFSIWTHYMKSIEFASKFQPQSCPETSPIAAVTVGAGNEWGEIYTSAISKGLLVVGGGHKTVGVGGYLTGGGHSPLGAMLGLGVDNVVEMQIVTPAGDLVTANECQNQDLFWAMKGGGGSTFGVMISATLKTHPDYPGAAFELSFESTIEEATGNNNTNFYSILAELYGYLPQWSDRYMNGYIEFASAPFVGLPTNSTADGPQQLGFTFQGWLHNQSLVDLESLMDPFLVQLNKTTGIVNSFSANPLSGMSEVLQQLTAIADNQVGINLVLGSRLLPKESLMDKEGLIKAFRTLEGETLFQGNLISGPAVRDPTKVASTSVTPSWREAYLHSLAITEWGLRNETAAQAAIDRNTNVYVRAFKDLAPDAGCYLNEADPFESDRNEVFWGSNYARLLQLKRQYDPKGLLWCLPCVGSEDWNVNATSGQLCKA